MASILPSPDALQRFFTTAEPTGPIRMLNLLRFRARAEYPDGFDAAPCSGAEAYGRYSKRVEGFVAEVGGKLAWKSTVAASLIAPDGEAWDLVLLVEYPSREAFGAMLRNPAYQAAVPHRTAALADSRLIACPA